MSSKIIALLVAVNALFAFGAETLVLPTDNQIADAQERGKTLRDQRQALPEALMTFAAIFKVKGQRCGHEFVSIEDAKGEAGAAYRYTERLKVSIPREQVEALDYTHVLLLSADLTLLSGKQIFSNRVNVNGVVRDERSIIDMQISDDTLILTRSEKIGDDPQKTFPPERTRLLGARPIPGKAIVALPAFTLKETKPLSGGTNPFMVTSMYMGWSKQAFNIQSVWLSFEDLDPAKNAGIKLRMSARFLDCEISEQGLMVEPPTQENWANAQVWSYGEKLNVIGLPGVSDAMLSIEVTDPAKLDFDAPLDREKIKAALNEAEVRRP